MAAPVKRLDDRGGSSVRQGGLNPRRRSWHRAGRRIIAPWGDAYGAMSGGSVRCEQSTVASRELAEANIN
jgi:hypothetical protein